MRRRSGSSTAEVVTGYDPAFLASMKVPLEGVEDPATLIPALDLLDPVARELAEGLLVGVGAGEVVPERLRPLIEEDGDDLWRIGLLVPRMAPSPGATIDPRHYAAYARLNPAFIGYRPLPDLPRSNEGRPHGPSSDARMDSIVLAAAVEDDHPRLTQGGGIRRDDERRLYASLGEDEERWAFAMAVGKAAGIVRMAAGRLYGIPEARPRPITDPTALLEDPGVAQAGAALLRVVGEQWISLDQLLDLLERTCPDVLDGSHPQPWADREARWFRTAADLFHRAGVVEAQRDTGGVSAVRLPATQLARPYGFLLTPDRDILVAPGELPMGEYGRLCRVAPYLGGDVVHRHKLTQEGVAADMAAGYGDLIEWLRRRSRTGVPPNVVQAIEQWMTSAARVTLLSGVDVLELPDGKLELLDGRVSGPARTLWYDRSPPARFEVHAGVLFVPYGEDALTVRAVLDRVGSRIPPSDQGHRWRLGPGPLEDPDAMLDLLRRFSGGQELAGELEAAVHAAGGRQGYRVEDAVVLHLGVEVAEAARRDRILAPLLGRALLPGQFVVARVDLGLLRARLHELGFASLNPVEA